MALVWQIPYKVIKDNVVVASLNIKALYTDKENTEFDITNQLKQSKIDTDWVELDEFNNILLVPNVSGILDLILEIEPIERNPKKKSFDGKILTPSAQEVVQYGY